MTPPRTFLATAGLTALLVLGAGCSSDSDSAIPASAGDVTVTPNGSTTGRGAPAALPTAAPSAPSAPSATSAPADGSTSGRGADAVGAEQPAIISTGDVVLRSKDVDVARGDVIAVMDSISGQLSDETTTSDKDGQLTSSHLVLRVPSRSFATAVDRIGRIGTRISSVTHSEDVTTKVVDVRSRLTVQRASVARITQLLDRARSIRDVVAIEGQLSQREADLESLEQQQAYLADQTSLSTITVRLERTAAAAKPGPIDDASVTITRHNFLGGLFAGSHALRAFGTVLAIISGALLPWLAALLVLGGPGLLLVRRLRRRRTAAPAAP